MARRIEPFVTEILHLGKGGTGVGTAPDGAPMDVPFAPPGGRVLVQPTGKRKGRWSGRRTELVEKPAAYAVPRCPQFGMCGGCALQELDGAAQADARARYARAEIAAGLGLPTEDLASRVRIHDHRRCNSDYGYRNKVELTFGVRRYLSDADHAAGLPVTGRFLGFHAPGRFDRVVDAPTCDLVPDALNAVLAVTRRLLLGDDGPSIYDVRTHQGFLRHLLLRRGARTGEVLARLYTATPACDADRDAANAWLDAVFGAALPDGRVVGASWAVSDAVADVAQGAVQASRGADRLDERLGDAVFSLSATSFFQTNTESAEVLYDAVGEALGDASGLLVDLYCGTGAIGLYLASRFDRVVGVEEHAAAVDDARENARRSSIHAEFRVGRVEEVLNPAELAGAAVVVDPPRVGLHPKAAAALARTDATILVYVACKPGSLGRDAAILEAGHWRMTDLWTVDLFPQTGHVEAVARFERR